MAKSKGLGLGQGVNLLFGEDQEEKFFECAIEKIRPNKFQPRTHFDSEQLEELAASIKEKGIIQPLIVSAADDGEYDLIAGERRLRASKLAGLTAVPVVILDVTGEDNLLELALIENIQRTDLNPLEEAEAYKKLVENFKYTQDEVARRVGKNRSTVTNMLRLLKLPQNIQQDVIDGTITEGHARTLLKIADDPVKLAEIRNLIVKNGLTVRQTEALVKKATSTAAQPKAPSKPKDASEEIPQSYRNSIVTQLTNRFNSKIAISNNGSRGKIEIEYYSYEDLDRVTSLLLGEG